MMHHVNRESQGMSRILSILSNLIGDLSHLYLKKIETMLNG